MDEAPLTFSAWYEREHPRVLGALVALSGDVGLAAEVTDEAFTEALVRWPRVSMMASPAGWTHRVALNGLRRRHRRRGTESRALAVVGARLGPHGETDPVGHPEVWSAVRGLPEKQRVAIVLRYVADLPEAAIAETMGVSRGTVASNLSDARRTLAVALRDASIEVTPGAASDAVAPSISEVRP